MVDSADHKLGISQLLLNVDPMGIYFKDWDNRDEYDLEAEELARLLPSCDSRGACLDAVLRVFQKYFGDLVASRAGNFEAVADGLWDLRRDVERGDGTSA